MSRLVILGLLVATPAFADQVEPPTPVDPAAPITPTTAPDPAAGQIVAVPIAAPDHTEQGIGASIGLAIGGRVTPGGLRIDGHYLYQLSDQDWFDGTASFTFGGGTAACFRDRSDAYVCDHGLTQGDAVGLAANVRHYMKLDPMGKLLGMSPFVGGGVGAGLVHFSNDGVTGLALPVHAAAGVRFSATDSIAVTAQGELDLGIGLFGHGLGIQPQLGAAISAGVEFKL